MACGWGYFLSLPPPGGARLAARILEHDASAGDLSRLVVIVTGILVNRHSRAGPKTKLSQ